MILRSPRVPIRAVLAVAFACAAAGCGAVTDLPGGGDTAAGRDAGADAALSAFPVGTYTRCAQGVRSFDGNDFLDVAGFEQGAVLTLAQSGDSVQATYVDENGAVRVYAFAQTTGTTATLVPSQQPTPGFSGLCVLGPGNEGSGPATMTAGAGALTYDQGAVFITIDGTLEDDVTPCAPMSTRASAWIVCDEPQGGAPEPAAVAVPTPPPALPVGEYACAAQLETYDAIDGLSEYVASGGQGALSVTQSGGGVTALYTGDSSVTGALVLDATTATTAAASVSQTLTAPCNVPAATGDGTGPSPAPATLDVTAASLAVTGETLIVSFVGSMDESSTCPGARVVGSVMCASH